MAGFDFPEGDIPVADDGTPLVGTYYMLDSPGVLVLSGFALTVTGVTATQIHQLTRETLLAQDVAMQVHQVFRETLLSQTYPARVHQVVREVMFAPTYPIWVFQVVRETLVSTTRDEANNICILW